MPKPAEEPPAAGKLVRVTPPEYRGTRVHHMLYLPADWSAEKLRQGERWPVVFEYTGNRFKRTGSTGRVDDAGLGYGLSGGRFIWASLAYVEQGGQQNAATWWGDTRATLDYAKTNVPRVIEQYGGDPDAVLLCGFSRGAIAVNYLGLHDDEIARLWSAFMTHDHFDGAKEWPGTDWGQPLAEYRRSAAERLRRVAGRPYLVSGANPASNRATREFIQSVLPSANNFQHVHVNMRKVLGSFPNAIAPHGHNDRWMLKPSESRSVVWEWVNQATVGGR